MITYGVAVGAAVFRALRYTPRLHGDSARYLRKMIYCALCYVDLGSRRSLREARRAGDAAFLSTLFDVATDWHGFDDPTGRLFARALHTVAGDREIERLAMTLYERKRTGDFAEDGLERGELALELITRTMDCFEDRRELWTRVGAGQMLQRIDDVLDWEDDRRRGELNCLASPRAQQHLDALIACDRDGDLARWFPGAVMPRVARRAAARAAVLRSSLEAADSEPPRRNVMCHQGRMETP